jgi:hypothetical protein
MLCERLQLIVSQTNSILDDRKAWEEKVAAGTGHICGISFDVIHHDNERE